MSLHHFQNFHSCIAELHLGDTATWQCLVGDVVRPLTVEVGGKLTPYFFAVFHLFGDIPDVCMYLKSSSLAKEFK